MLGVLCPQRPNTKGGDGLRQGGERTADGREGSAGNGFSARPQSTPATLSSTWSGADHRRHVAALEPDELLRGDVYLVTNSPNILPPPLRDQIGTPSRRTSRMR